MAFEWMAWAVKQKTGKPVSKAVLIALSNYADENGFCYPSIKKIQEVTENGERAIRNALEHLEEIGLIKRGDRRRRKDGTLGVYEYQLTTSGTRCHRHEMPKARDAARLGEEKIDVKQSSQGDAGENCDQSPPARGAAHNQSLNIKPVTKKNNPTDYKKKKPHRLPDDWVCDVGLGEWAMDQGLARGEVVQEIEQFKDHYRAATGKGSTALDWEAKFRTWVRNTIKWKR